MTTPPTEQRPCILHMVDSLGVGGTELSLASLIERTAAQFYHYVCCIRDLGGTASRLRELGVPVELASKRSGKDLGLPFRLTRICRAVQPDIVHTRNWGAIEGVVAARLARVPVVIHGEHGRHADDVRGTNARRNRLRRWLSPWLQRFVTVSEDLARWLTLDVGISAAKVTVLRNGVDLKKFAFVEPREKLRAAEGTVPMTSSSAL